jgi:hypothetical protein
MLLPLPVMEPGFQPTLTGARGQIFALAVQNFHRLVEVVDADPCRGRFRKDLPKVCKKPKRRPKDLTFADFSEMVEIC